MEHLAALPIDPMYLPKYLHDGVIPTTVSVDLPPRLLYSIMAEYIYSGFFMGIETKPKGECYLGLYYLFIFIHIYGNKENYGNEEVFDSSFRPW